MPDRPEYVYSDGTEHFVSAPSPALGGERDGPAPARTSSAGPSTLTRPGSLSRQRISLLFCALL